MKITIDIDENKKAITGFVIPQGINPLDAIQIFNSVSNSVLAGLRKLQDEIKKDKGNGGKIIKPSFKDIKNVKM